MQNFNIIKQNKLPHSFRAKSIINQFDIEADKITETFSGNINLPKKWNVGVIYGRSGTGKTTIAKHLFPDQYVTHYEYNEPCILDDMPPGASTKKISKCFNQVGFSSPPSWLKPYNILSEGEKMRVNLARAILEKKEIVVFDEYTSTVDRAVAKIGSLAVQKAIRENNKKFIAVSCHDDILNWLNPDWVFCTNEMEFQKKNFIASKSKSIYTREEKVCGPFLGSIII